MTEYIVEDRLGVRILRLAGDLTISRAEGIKVALLESLQGAEHIEIDLSLVEEADLSCLQLLCSAHRTSKRMGKFFQLRSNASGPFKQSVRSAGYARLRGCMLDRDNQCIWKAENYHG